MSDLIDNPVKLYQKKPVKVEAILFDDQNQEEVVEWIEKSGGTVNLHGIEDGKEYIDIHTLEGNMHAVEGDYIIKGVKGEFYPCKPDIFEMTYEGVS